MLGTEDIQIVKGHYENKVLAFSEISEFISHRTNIDMQILINGFTDRERESNTAIGEGFAIPHAILSGIEQSYVFLHIIDDGVNWDAYDGEDVQIIFSLVVAKDLHNKDHLRKISSIAYSLMDDEYKHGLKTCRRKDVLVKIIEEMGGIL